jgi:1,2-dihydroxy-3-keto-5-methylthiopentene dioxygenase
MSRLTIFEDTNPDHVVLLTEDAALMGATLATIGVLFERWESPVALAPEATPEEILQAYRPYLDRLMGDKGAGSADVIKLTPDNPAGPAMRAKFLNEHLHTEDEIRFFVQGSGHFIMHVNGRVYDALCCQGDLISVPAQTKHWFDAGTAPDFTALRVFTDTSGWVAHFTGDAISAKFPITAGVAAA